MSVLAIDPLFKPHPRKRTLVNGVLVLYPRQKRMRDLLREEKRCINGPRDPNQVRGVGGVEHGPVVSGGKCQRCLDVCKASR